MADKMIVGGFAASVAILLVAIVAVVVFTILPGGGEPTPYEVGYDNGYRYAQFACEQGLDAADEYAENQQEEISVAVVNDPQFDIGLDDGVDAALGEMTIAEIENCP